MEYRPLGNTDIKVSAICLGTMTFGRQNDEQEGHEQLDCAFAAGVNFIDTAELYPVPMSADTYGDTESIVGTWLKKRGKRNDVVVATKIAGPIDPHPAAPPPLEWIRGGVTKFNRRHIVEAVDCSLRRLQTDYIDLYQLHWPERNTTFFGETAYQEDKRPFTPFAETLEALAEQQQAGKIRHIGLSNETPWGLSACLQLANTAGLPRVQSVQNPYSLLNRSYELGMAEISVREQCGLLPYSPLAFGVLTGKYMGGARPPKARMTLFPHYKRYTTNKANAAVEAYAALAKKRGVDLAQMALAFSVQQPFVTSSIIGATTLPQLQENLAAANFVLEDDLRQEINAVGKAHFIPCP